MRLSTTMMTSFTALSYRPRPNFPQLILAGPICPNLSAHGPDREHGNDDRHELQRHAPAHQLLRGIRRAATHHVEEAQQEHQRDGANGDGKDKRAEKGSHRRYITPSQALRHLRDRWRGFDATIWPFDQYYQMVVPFNIQPDAQGDMCGVFATPFTPAWTHPTPSSPMMAGRSPAISRCRP